MSSDIFDLDEEREAAQRTEQVAGPSQSVTQASSAPASSSASQVSSTHLRVATNPNLLSPLPQPLGQHRKHASSFAATPSFPSPLAQAITVPPHSDTSESGSQSSGSGGEEEKKVRDKRTSSDSKGKATTRRGFEPQILRPRTASPQNKDPSSSLAPTANTDLKSAGVAKTVTPGSLLTKTRRPDAAHILPPITTASPGTSPRTSPNSARSSPTHSRRLTDVSTQYFRELPAPGGSQGRPRSGSHTSSLNVPTGSQTGSSPLAFGSPELYPADDEHRSSRASTGSPQESARDGPNILGLGLGSNWEATSNASSSSRSGSVKGKSKEAPSPRRERDRSSIGAMPISR